MKNFFRIAGYVFAGILAVLYIAFLFVIPNTINLDKYKPDIQKLVKDNTDLTVDFGKVKVITSPFLEAGIKTDNITVKLPDNSVLFSADSFKGKVFLPSLLWLTVRVSCAEINNPELNVEIINSEKYKVAKVYEDLVNKKREERRLNPPKEIEPQELPFDPTIIKVVVPGVKLNNYSAVIDDTKAAHKLTLKGDLIKLGYFNGKSAKLKADAAFFSDSDKNITANLDIDTFLPKFTPAEQDDDEEGVFELPFVNPVSVYRDYNLKSNINSKIKIRKGKKDNKIWAKGFLNIDGTTVTLSGMQLPESYFKFAAKGHRAEFDTNLFVTDKEYLKMLGSLSNGRNPYIDLSVKSTQVHLSNLLNIARAYLDTLHIKNDVDAMSANGYLYSNFRMKTDFSDLESNGKFIIRGGNISDKNIGLLFNDINANLLFDDNKFKITDTHVMINDRPLSIAGQMESNSFTDINIQAQRVPLPGLYSAFAPREIKNSYLLKSGFLTLDTKFTGEIKNISALLKADLEDFIINDKKGNFSVSNKISKTGITDFNGDIKGKVINRGFKVNLPAANSVISDDFVNAVIDNKNITVDKSYIKFNKSSQIAFNGKVSDYLSNPEIKFSADGALSDEDLKTLAGSAAAPYLFSNGAIPVKAGFEAKGEKMKAVLQAATNAKSFITPVEIKDFRGRQMLLQLLAEKNGNVLKVHKTGLYLRKPNAQFTDNLGRNILNTKEVIGVRAIVSNLNTNPFINLFKVTIPKDLNGKICIFDKSKFTFGGSLFAFGKVKSPKISGKFYIRNLAIPEIFTTVRNIVINLGSRDVDVIISDVLANGSDFNIQAATNWNLLQKMKLSQVKVFSNLIDVDKIMKVSDALLKALPAGDTSTSQSTGKKSDIPVEILGGNINIRKITTGNIVVNATRGDISLIKNVFYINKLKTRPMGGIVTGDASMNLLTTELNAKVAGKNFDIEKVLLDAANMKDMVSGTMNFLADISMSGTTQTEQMKSLKGTVDFNVENGQLGPFGKFENFLMAENLRENAFFSSTIGSVITNIVTIDTSHFNKLFGHLTFKDGIANIAPIKSQGNVMSMYIAGKVGLIDNSADMKVRGKLASAFSDSLGPLANINPVNLIKNTPGLNVVAAKTFSIFCEEVSEAEMKALPPLGEGKSDDYATKFQIVLRGDTRKPLKMIKSFKWLALNSDIEAAKGFVDTIPVPAEGEEGLSVDELIKVRAQQAAENTAQTSVPAAQEQEQNKGFVQKFKSLFKKDKV